MCTTLGYRRALLLVLLAVAGCGGGVGGIGSSGGGGTGSSGGGGMGSSGVGSGGGGSSSSGGTGSPGFPGCASGAPIGTGQACEVDGVMCPLGTLRDCDGNLRTLECICNGRTWTCDRVPQEPCAPPPACPDPSMLLPGSSCDVPENQQCVSIDVVVPNCGGGPPTPTKSVCQCVGGAWSCPVGPIPTCAPPPPQPCPDPSQVYAGGYCNSIGTCSGNPTYCAGDLYYDALDCESGQWVTIAATACDIAEDASIDAPIYVDAGTATVDGS